MAGARARGAHPRREPVGTFLRQRGEPELVEPDGTRPAAGSRGDHQLDRRDAVDTAAPFGTPGKADLPAADPHLVPGPVEDLVALGIPPDVFPGPVYQLEFEGIGRRLTLDPEGEGIARRERDGGGAARDGIVDGEVDAESAARDGIAAALEGELEAQRFAALPRAVPECQLDPVGRVRRPCFRALEIVEQTAGGDGSTLQRDGQQEQSAHPFTLPAMMPWM